MARISIAAFQSIVLTYHRNSGRHDLPWRLTHNPYRILVSEVMLQQTQVPRVIEKYREFLKKFPTTAALARAPLSDVLKVWSGLGYNRRAKYLHDAAKTITTKHRGRFPRTYEELRALSGVGEYTAKAVRVFAFGESEVLIETNVRAVYLHHFFPRTSHVTDQRIRTLAEKGAMGVDARQWHAALMDYGTYLKEQFPNPSRRSKTHTKPSKFEGSLRQVRGALLRMLQNGALPEREIMQSLTKNYLLIRANKQVANEIFLSLERDGLIVKNGRNWALPQ